MQTESPQKHFHELLTDFDTAMLVTKTAQGQSRARPMAVADVESDSDLWFITDAHAGKLDEIKEHPEVCVCFQGNGNYLSLSGAAHTEFDHDKVVALWKEPWKVWFPDGPDDSNICLIKVQATMGEFWDNSGSNSLEYFFEAGKAYVSGTRPDLSEDMNQKVNLS